MLIQVRHLIADQSPFDENPFLTRAYSLGFGGQSFQNVNPKIKDIKQFIEENNLDTEIVVDGGMNAKTVHAVVENGAATVIAGSFLFQHPVSFEQGLRELRGQNSS